MVKVSVIIPTFNRAKFITRAVDSVLSQTFQNFEIIVIDDGSTDNTKDLLDLYVNKIRYFYQGNKGISAARNKGIMESKGEYLAFLDSDDTWQPEKLAIQVDILDKNPKIGIVFNRLIILDEQGKKVGYKPEKKTGRNFMELIEIGGDLPTSSIMTRRICFDKAGLFDEALPIMEDFEMWLRIAKDYEIFDYQEKPLAHYYRHGNQVTKNRIKVYEGTVKLYEKMIRTHHIDPREGIVKFLGQNQYMLARAYFDEGKYQDAYVQLCRTLARFPLVGIQLFNLNDSLFTKMAKMVKPYLFLGVCFMKRRQK